MPTDPFTPRPNTLREDLMPPQPPWHPRADEDYTTSYDNRTGRLTVYCNNNRTYGWMNKHYKSHHYRSTLDKVTVFSTGRTIIDYTVDESNVRIISPCTIT